MVLRSRNTLFLGLVATFCLAVSGRGSQYNGNMFLNGEYKASAKAHQQLFSVNPASNIFLEHAIISRQASPFQGPTYLPPPQFIKCGGGQQCVRKNVCQSGYYTQKQSPIANCNPESDVCCSYRPPATPPPTTPKPFVSCRRDQDCVSPNDCQNGEIVSTNYIHGGSSNSCYAPNVCCLMPSTTLTQNGYQLKVPETKFPLPTVKTPGQVPPKPQPTYSKPPQVYTPKPTKPSNEYLPPDSSRYTPQTTPRPYAPQQPQQPQRYTPQQPSQPQTPTRYTPQPQQPSRPTTSRYNPPAPQPQQPSKPTNQYIPPAPQPQQPSKPTNQYIPPAPKPQQPSKPTNQYYPPAPQPQQPSKPTNQYFPPAPQQPQRPSKPTNQYIPPAPQPQRPQTPTRYSPPAPKPTQPTRTTPNRNYLPPNEKDNEVPKESRTVTNRVYSTTTPKPRRGESILSPSIVPNIKVDVPRTPAKCASALLCTAEEYCNSIGVISDTPVDLSPASRAFRVPLTDCIIQDSGALGKCCRDSNYVDPWPVNMAGICGTRNRGTKPTGISEIDANFGEIPWQAMILKQSSKSLLCGGAIIGAEHVLTTAECVRGLSESDCRVKAGEWELGNDSEPLPFQIVGAKYIKIHPTDDMAIIRLDKPLQFASHIKPICISDQDPGASEKCITSGWGKQAIRAHEQGAIMHVTDTNALSRSECSASQTSVCSSTKFDTCQFDAGSALACGTSSSVFLKGVYSGENSCGEGQPVRFTKPDIKWINEEFGERNKAIFKTFN